MDSGCSDYRSKPRVGSQVLLPGIIIETEVATMKAIQMHGYGGVDQLRYEDVPAPTAGPGEVLVRVAATSVNPIDWKIRRGNLKGMTLQFPVIPGRDVAGEVVAVGAGVSNFKPGQKVMALTNHTYAELVVVPSAALATVPDGLELQQAGALPLVTTTGAALIEHVGPHSGQTVLVTGALGGVGRTAVYVATERGARVIAGVRERQKRQAQALGADQVIAIDSDSEIRSLPDLDAIADTVDGEVIGKLIAKLKRGGVLGSVLGKPKAAEGQDIRVEAFSVQPNPAVLARLAEAVRKGSLSIPVVKTFKLSEAAAAQKLAEEGKVEGKIVLMP
jgi:NADPH:quinone reductase-like Zn-dependent oxidoreductase